MFDHLIDVNELAREFEEHKLHEEDMAFIRALIEGDASKVQRSDLGSVTCLHLSCVIGTPIFCHFSVILQGVPPRNGRTRDMGFLYQVNVYTKYSAYSICM